MPAIVEYAKTAQAAWVTGLGSGRDTLPRVREGLRERAQGARAPGVHQNPAVKKP